MLRFKLTARNKELASEKVTRCNERSKRSYGLSALAATVMTLQLCVFSVMTFQHGDDVPTYGLGLRHVQVFVMSVAAFTAYVLRANLNIAIVAMVDNHVVNNTDHLAETFDWDGEIQGYVLSSFYWGYITTQIPAGMLTDRFGGHRFLCGAVIVASFMSVISPHCAYIGGWMLVCANRVLQGVSQGFIFPSIYSLLAVWAPPAERNKFTSASTSAQLLGTVAATPLSGYLCAAYGWPSAFYAIGAVCAVTGLGMIFLGADSPSKHRMISDPEKRYIQLSLDGPKEKLPVPWKSVLTSAPYLSTACAAVLHSAVYITFLVKIPTYLGTVLNFDMKENGFISALPFLTSYILSFVCSWVCDFLISRGYLKLTSARKLFNSIAHFGEATAFVLLAHAENRTMSVVYLTMGFGCMSGVFVGTQASFVELAPNFSGAIYSVSNFLGALSGLCGPILVGFIVTETGSAEQWKIVFYICAAVVALGNVPYVIWGTSKTQWWNWPDRYNDAKNLKQKKETEKVEEENCPKPWSTQL